jgi:hypothetical protein
MCVDKNRNLWGYDWKHSGFADCNKPLSYTLKYKLRWSSCSYKSLKGN